MARVDPRAFFKEKRPWSRRKDFILGWYLTPYLRKIATQGRPIHLVDGFAGPGKFGDGSPGSPLIMCQKVKAAVDAGMTQPVKVLCIEPDAVLHGDLAHLIGQFSFAEARHGELMDSVPELVEKAPSHSTFLYLDPFATHGVDWTTLDQLFRRIDAGDSVEVLLNFNVVAFARVARQVLKMPKPDEEAGFDEEADWLATVQTPTAERLDAMAGGDWWRAVVKKGQPFQDEIRELATTFCERMKGRFSEVCLHVIKENWKHSVPKYVLVFGSRHPHATRLINDAMAKSRDEFEEGEVQEGGQLQLIDTRPVRVAPGNDVLEALILHSLTGRMTRAGLSLAVMRRAIGLFTQSQINKRIGVLAKQRRVVPASGKTRLNDEAVLWAGEYELPHLPTAEELLGL